MTDNATKHGTDREIDLMAEPLAWALGNIRATLKCCDEAAIWKTFDAMNRCGLLDPRATDLCGSQHAAALVAMQGGGDD